MLRAPWGPASEEESRAYLQSRLTAFSKVMFWALIVDVVFVNAMYGAYPTIRPVDNNLVLVEATVSLASLAYFWRGLLVRRKLSIAALERLDVIYGLWVGVGLGLSAYFGRDLHPSAYAALTWTCFMVLLRALIVPSTEWRTLVVSALTLVPVNLAALGIVWIAAEKQDLPGPAFVLGGMVFSAVAVVLASIGSRIIYGLRRQARTAEKLGQYTLEHRIAAGGMGEIYRARHSLLRRPTAIKLLLPAKVGPENLERFEREVQEMSQLTHPNTVAVFDYGHRDDGVFYYVMEYLGDGIDLEKLVRKHGPQPAGRVAKILAQVCGALHEAHSRGLVHRDIKPANIILCERGLVPDVAKVVDFGLVKELASDVGASAQMIVGTAAYLAPEVVTGAISPAVDLYALGAVGYFLVTGRKVFEGNTQLEVLVKHTTTMPTPPSQVPGSLVSPELEAVIMKCLAKQPEDRYASADVLAEALRAVPPTPGWDAEEARRWWRDLRAADTAATVASHEPTLTITVDLGERVNIA